MENTFEFKGQNYNIINENKGDSEMSSWEEKTTDVVRTREIFAWMPWWVGNKFRWMKKITISENLRFVRYSDFDSGWTYQEYWKPWKMEWVVTEILS